MSIELVGWVAVVLTQVFWFPNISKILRTRDVQGYSLMAWLIMLCGLSCWLAYFMVKGDIVGIVANISGVTGAGITTACIWFWGAGSPACRTSLTFPECRSRRLCSASHSRRISDNPYNAEDSVN